MRKDYRPIAITGDIAVIFLTKGQQTVIDVCDVPRVDTRLWSACWSPHRRCFYASCRIVNARGRNSRAMLHRFILGITDPAIFVDHINHDPLDNRRSNLRTCTPAESNLNKRTYSSNLTGFKGVRFVKKNGLYTAFLKKDGVVYEKHGFITSKDAFIYRQEVLSKLHGEFYCAG